MIQIQVPDGKLLVGVDEVGYGAIAGEVTVCAVHIPPGGLQAVQDLQVRDSKKLSPARRERIVEWLHQNAGYAHWGISSRDPGAIDRYGPVDARDMAAVTALVLLEQRLGVSLNRFHIVMDGNLELPGLPSETTQQAIPKADDLVLPVSVASVLAKVTRDASIRQLHDRYPQYGFDSHAGYGTSQHVKALYELGMIPNVHRVSYLANTVTNYARKHQLPVPAWYRTLQGGSHGT